MARTWDKSDVYVTEVNMDKNKKEARGRRDRKRESERDRKKEYYQIRSCGIVELLNTVQIGLRITLVSKTEWERPQLIH